MTTSFQKARRVTSGHFPGNVRVKTMRARMGYGPLKGSSKYSVQPISTSTATKGTSRIFVSDTTESCCRNSHWLWFVITPNASLGCGFPGRPVGRRVVIDSGQTGPDDGSGSLSNKTNGRGCRNLKSAHPAYVKQAETPVLAGLINKKTASYRKP